MPTRSRNSPSWVWGGPALVACAAWLAIGITLDPVGDYPNLPNGPGLTVDETFNVQQGVYLVEAIHSYGLGLLHPDSIREVFGNPGFLPDHPPLGRLWLGIVHHVVQRLWPPKNPQLAGNVACARLASATAFALTILLVGYVTGKWYGAGAGTTAAAAILLTPRLFGHAHLASLETCIGLAYAAVVLSLTETWARRKTPSVKVACVSGIVFGLALLTKIQAVLLIVPVVVWAFWFWRRRAVVWLLVWGATAFCLFFLAWPWLWLDPVHHLAEYFGRTTQRASLSVWYMGHKFADRAVPWHYPWILFLTTIPVGLHVLGFVGLRAGGWRVWNDRGTSLLLGVVLFPLCLFSLPGIAVYDGVRLFLVVYPIWAIFIGRGGLVVWEWLRAHVTPHVATLLLAIFLMFQGSAAISLHPCYLSYYNLLVGGLRGAERLGMEPTYWGDALTRSLLQAVVDHVPRGSTVAVTPALHRFQWPDLQQQSPILREHGITFRVYGTHEASRSAYLLLFRRNADLPPQLRAPPAQARLLAEVRRSGVQLAALYEIPQHHDSP